MGVGRVSIVSHYITAQTMTWQSLIYFPIYLWLWLCSYLVGTLLLLPSRTTHQNIYFFSFSCLEKWNANKQINHACWCNKNLKNRVKDPEIKFWILLNFSIIDIFFFFFFSKRWYTCTWTLTHIFTKETNVRLN